MTIHHLQGTSRSLSLSLRLGLGLGLGKRQRAEPKPRAIPLQHFIGEAVGNACHIGEHRFPHFELHLLRLKAILRRNLGGHRPANMQRRRQHHAAENSCQRPQDSIGNRSQPCGIVAKRSLHAPHRDRHTGHKHDGIGGEGRIPLRHLNFDKHATPPARQRQGRIEREQQSKAHQGGAKTTQFEPCSGHHQDA